MPVAFLQRAPGAEIAVAYRKKGFDLPLSERIETLFDQEKGRIFGYRQPAAQADLPFHQLQEAGGATAQMHDTGGNPVWLLADGNIGYAFWLRNHHVKIAAVKSGDGTKLVAKHQKISRGDVLPVGDLSDEPPDGVGFVGE